MNKHSSFSQLPAWLVPVTAVSTLLLVILFALGVLGGDKKTEPGNTKLAAQALPAGAATLKVGMQMEANTLSWQGTVRSRQVVELAPKMSARILEIPVHPGDRLKKGAVVARLDDRELRAAYNAAHDALLAARAQAVQAAADERRITDLYDRQAATRQNYDAVVAQAKSTQARANQAASIAEQGRVQLGENVLYAPFDGVVSERLQEPGDMGMPSQAVISFLKPDDLRLETSIPARCAALVRLGMKVDVRADVTQQKLTGVVDEIAPEVDPQTRTQQIKISLPHNSGLQPGQFGWLELACQAEQQMLLVPDSAILNFGQLQAVKVIQGQQLQIRHIRTGKRYGDKLEVLSGLHDGETILISGGLTK
ncbi:MAG: efflux RND transporter periplasmic adaptor subunit [Methylococcales bacterium]|nr:efflux RND transporter periplasmic adaptor subunit [Methylococcales bacterium]